MRFVCAHCGNACEKSAGEVNRARSASLNLYCDRRCSGLGRRKHKTKAQRIEEKRLYDAAYRAKNLSRIKAKKAAYFRATYDPEKARVERKKTMPRHVEYCRRPEYKRQKSEYDRQRRTQEYGAFAEAYQLTIELNREIKGRMTNEQIKWENQTANKTQKRRRQAEEKERSRPRGRDRRDTHSSALG